MKSIITSVSPYLCEKIVSGDCKILVKKSVPKEVPFRAYIYCTKTKNQWSLCDYEGAYQNSEGEIVYAQQHIIGEFICDKIEDFYCASVPYLKENNLGYGQFVDNGVYKVNGWHESIVFERNDRYIETMLNNDDLKEICLSAQELFDYIGVGKHLYSWHISDLKIYGNPKKLSEFKTPPCEKPEKACGNCKWLVKINTPDVYECECYVEDGRQITSPPRSWMYVEEIETR